MNSIEKLTQIFSQFPGVGPKQARRFVYYLLTRGNGTLEELAKNILELKKETVVCAECMRFFPRRSELVEKICGICADSSRNREILIIVERDVDLESMEKNGDLRATYFVLGGSVPILEKEPEKKIRIKELLALLEKRAEDLREVILATNWNPEGENTASFVTKQISPAILKHKIKLSHLGKGLSMGTELEYTDQYTLKNALKNRS